MSFDNLMGYILSISMYMQNFITTFHSVQKIAPLSLFQNLDLGNINVSAKFYQNIPNGLRVNFHSFQNLNLGKTSTNPKCSLTISWATSCQYQCVCKIASQYSAQFRDMAISQSLGLDLINIHVYAKVYQNILFSSRDRDFFTFFQNLNLGNASANLKWYLTISWVTSCQYHRVCKLLSKYSKRFKSYRYFSRTGRRQNLHKQAGDKIKCLIIGHS